MRIVHEWLSELVKIPADVEVVAREISLRGFEVASVEHGVIDFEITANRPDCLSMIGLAREIAAIFGGKARMPDTGWQPEGPPADGLLKVEIEDPELCARYTGAVVQGMTLGQAPKWMRRRLEMAGMRSVNNVVDITNYVMLELGQPLHAFDYNKVEGQTIIVRRANEGEHVVTLDHVDRPLDTQMLAICDIEKPIALAGVMGGSETEVYDASKEVLDAVGKEVQSNEKLQQGKASVRGTSTANVLLEGAAWNFINIRKTAKQHNLPSEASFRFSRGVHPALAEQGVKRGLQLMAEWSGGKVAPGLVDAYPLQPTDPTIAVSPRDVKRLIGIDLTAQEIAELLTRLEFECTVDSQNDLVQAKTPPHRLDIGEGIVGLADVIEEVARSYGFDRIPETRMADALPPQIGNPVYEWEEQIRDILSNLGLQEVVNYRLTSPERESRLISYDDYVALANAIAPERRVLRRSLLASVLEAAEKNARAESISMFEIGPIFEPVKNGLPNEPRKLAIVMTGLRNATAWDVKDSALVDFFDMKGRIELLLSGLRLAGVSYTPADSVPHLHPGKSAEVKVNGQVVGVFGELHPLVKDKYDFGESAVIVAEFDLDALRNATPTYGIAPVSEFPPVFEYIAVILDESVAAERVESLIRQTGGKTVTNVRLFDVYRDEKIGAGKKSLAYNLTYQSDKTMTDAEAAAIRTKIVKRLEHEVGAKLRS